MKSKINLIFKSAIFISIFLFSSLSIAQNDNLIEAFTKSYQYEKNGNYTAAISTLKNVYLEDSYECNLRLGWLTYNAGLYQESISYYQKAINLMPVSIEARLGYVYPAAAFGNMTNVILQYKKILEIDPQNSLANYKLGYIYYDKKDCLSTIEELADTFLSNQKKERSLNDSLLEFETYKWIDLGFSSFISTLIKKRLPSQLTCQEEVNLQLHLRAHSSTGRT